MKNRGISWESLLGRGRLGIALGLALVGTAFGQAEWWQNPGLKYKESTGFSAPGAGPHYWNKDESEQYLFCPVGFLPADAGVLYSLPALVSATSSVQVAPIVSGSAASLYGGAWKGGALSDDLGRILTGNGDSTTRHASLPLGNPCAWTKDTTVFSITNQGSASTGIDGMAFSHDSQFLYSSLYNPSADRNKIRQWNVGNLAAGGVGLTSNATFTTSLIRVRNVSVYYIGGKDLIFYGEGGGGGKVCVMDPATGVETRLVTNGLPTGSAVYDVVNVKVAGIRSGRLHLYVQLDSGSLYVYDLAADGQSVGACVKTFTNLELQGLLGASWPNMRAFEVMDDESHAFFSHHWGNGGPSTNPITLYVVNNLTPPVIPPASAPVESYISPSYLTVTYSEPTATAAVVTVEGPSGTLPGQFMGQYSFLVRYPLSTNGVTALTLHCSGADDRATNVLWCATDLSAYPPLERAQLQVGDSLLLTAGVGLTGALEIAIADTNGQTYTTCSGVAGARFPVRFDNPGQFEAVARIDGNYVGSLIIQVIRVDYQGPMACQLAFRREKSIVITGPTQDVTYVSGDPSTLEVSVKELTAQGARLYLKPLHSGTPVLQVRFGSVLIPIVTRHEVDEFMIRTQAVTVMPLLDTFPDGSLLVGSNIEMFPKVENLDVVVSIYRAGITFDDSSTSKTFNSSDFTYDPASGVYLMPFRLIVSPSFTGGVCHSIAVYQAGELVGGE